MFGKSTRSAGQAMTSAPQRAKPEAGPAVKPPAPQVPKLHKKEPSFGRKNVWVREKNRLGKASSDVEVFKTVQEAQVVAEVQRARYLEEQAERFAEPLPPSVVHANAPYGWFVQEPDPAKERRPLTPVLSPSKRRSGMKVTEQRPDGAELRKACANNENYAARGRKQMESSVFDGTHLHRKLDKLRNGKDTPIF
jgi:hypothetical protein